MAATKTLGGVLAAALALPGVQAETAPEAAELAVKQLHYQDRQPGLRRTQVRAPSASLLLPLGEQWSLEAGAVQDSVSGASPRWHSAISSASRQSEQRHATELRLNHHGARSGWSVGAVRSDENDFHSKALSAEGRWASEDQNRSWTLGAALTRDRIGATGRPDLNERRQTRELMLALTQVWSPVDLVQLGLSHSRGHGYYDDPYKFPDHRPAARRQTALNLRWNHHFAELQATLRSRYGWVQDSFGLRGHTVELQWQQALGPQFSLTPGLRHYSQRAARFYVDPLPGSDQPPRAPAGEWVSADARLAGFGALAVSLKAEWTVDAHWTLDLRGEHYRQRAGLRLGGQGSAGLAGLDARQWQLGLRYRF